MISALVAAKSIFRGNHLFDLQMNIFLVEFGFLLMLVRDSVFSLLVVGASVDSRLKLNGLESQY